MTLYHHAQLVSSEMNGNAEKGNFLGRRIQLFQAVIGRYPLTSGFPSPRYFFLSYLALFPSLFCSALFVTMEPTVCSRSPEALLCKDYGFW